MVSYYTYVDWTNEPVPRAFYVGKGNEARARGTDRNRHHANVVNKHGLTREVALVTDDEDEAFQREIELIAEHHTFIDDPSYNGIGCNYTPGGEGHTPTRKQVEEYSRRMKARWADPAKRATLVTKMRGKKHASGPRPKQSVAISGANNPNYGKPMPESRKEKLRHSKRGVPSPMKGRKMRPGAMAKKMKQVIVTANGTTRAFPSRKEAAHVLGNELGLSHHTLLCYFVAREKTFHGLTFTYPGDDQ
jgi:hypothetical protein